MKKLNIILSFCTLILFSSCIKQLEKTYTSHPVAEIDAAVLNANSVNVTYPIISRVLPEGRPFSTTLDSTLRRLSGNVKVRINLVGPQSENDQTVGYTLFSSPITTFAFPATITGQTPSRAAATLNVSDALAGTHFTALSGKATIPAKSSFGYITIPMLPNSAATEARFIGIKLDSTGTVLPSLNYRQLGLVIDQR
jgi:hypothetical protein